MPKTLDEALTLAWMVLLAVVVLKTVYWWLKYKDGRGSIEPSDEDFEDGSEIRYVPPLPPAEDGTLGVTEYPFRNLREIEDE